MSLLLLLLYLCLKLSFSSRQRTSVVKLASESSKLCPDDVMPVNHHHRQIGKCWWLMPSFNEFTLCGRSCRKIYLAHKKKRELKTKPRESAQVLMAK